jgi:hypothetical protein
MSALNFLSPSSQENNNNLHDDAFQQTLRECKENPENELKKKLELVKAQMQALESLLATQNY